MFRIFAFTLAALASMSTLAQTTYDPKIAYVLTSGKSSHLYLANGDGTRAVRLATGVGNINGIDFAPGGGRIAFSDKAGLNVLGYVASNTGITVTGVQLVVPAVGNFLPARPDFSPDGNRIVYHAAYSSAGPNTIHIVAVPSAVHLWSFECYLCEEPRWLRPEVGDAIAYLRWNPDTVPNTMTREVWTALINPDGSSTAALALTLATQEFKAISWFDVAHTHNALLLSASGTPYPRTIEFDYLNGTLANKGPGAWDAHYTSDDSRIIYREQTKAGFFISSHNPATGVSTRLSAKGSYGVVDTRP